ncbi:NprX family peptide pheromone [Bacillus cytotoxicus]|nr:NprX family peptide pheromone [Bacillus cytotoxicus]QTR80534.1 NprX family peptide pheromone [Bacillus cytotoxicus]HDR7309097.1 NprX family peptide pheromone [Bacillus cytotoxicus]HDR7864323.1 NprX family peptide pheromone [Bacillus cytotoxicus]
MKKVIIGVFSFVTLLVTGELIQYAWVGEMYGQEANTVEIVEV